MNADHPIDLKGAKILIGDDIPANLNILRDVLEPQGYKIMVATNGAAVLDIASRAQPDLVLLDVMMPEMNGFEVCRSLKSNEELKDIPVIFITAKDGVENLMEGFASGGVDYIRKPFQIEEVRVRVKNHLQLWKLRQSLLDNNQKLEQEISVRREMEEKQQQLLLEKQKVSEAASRLEATETLAGGLAHDFNNLITVILGNVSMIRRKLDEDHSCIPMLSMIENASEQAADLTRQMLAYARGGKYQPELIDPLKIVAEVIRLQQWNLPNNIRISFTGNDLWKMEADTAQLQQTLMAIISNSVEAIGEKIDGEIQIKCDNFTAKEEIVDPIGDYSNLQPGNYVRLSVHDNGSGMSSETMSRVFEPFFTTKFQGRGMGLAAVYGTIKNHGGHIGVESEIGEGSTFTILLPASAISEVSDYSDNSIDDSVNVLNQETITILIVDDDEPVLNIIEQLLKQHGYKTLTALNGQEAVDIAKSFEGNIDLTLLDMSMPIMGGAEAYPLLKKERPDLKIIICSGYELDENMKKTLNEGADAFIQKPFHFEKMISEIQKTLKASV